MVVSKLAVCLFGGLLICSCAAASSAQSGQSQQASCAAVAGPCVDKVDPPNWWAGLRQWSLHFRLAES